MIHAVHEDPKNPNLVYIGTERGLYLSADRGAHWIEFRSNLPRVPVNDFVIHPRDNDLVLATHGRGVWILDDIASLQQLTPAVMSEPAHLFPVRAAAEIRYFNPRAHEGDMVFHGAESARRRDRGLLPGIGGRRRRRWPFSTPSGQEIASVPATANAGVNRAVWNLRYAALPAPPPDEESGRRRAAMPGPLVMPGEYTVRLTAGGRTLEQKVEVNEDPRIQVSPANRKAWTDAMLSVAETYRGVAATVERLDRQPGAAADLKDVARELQSRVITLYRALDDSTAQPTADQRAQIEFFKSELDSLRKRVQ